MACARIDSVFYLEILVVCYLYMYHFYCYKYFVWWVENSFIASASGNHPDWHWGLPRVFPIRDDIPSFINHLLLFFCFCYCYCYEYFVRWVKNCFYCIQQSSRLAFAKIVAYLWWHPLIPLPWWHSLSILYSFCTGFGNHRDWHLRLPRLVPTALVAFPWWHSLSVLYILYMYMLIKDNWKQPFYWFWIGV